MMKTTPPRYCTNTEIACIQVTGPDAQKFLRAQLTANPPPADARLSQLAAWLDARGRVRALFRIVNADDGYILLAEREAAQLAIEGLRRFILRSRVELVLNESLIVVACIGNATAWYRERGLASMETPNGVAVRGQITWLNVATDFVLAFGPADAIAREYESANEFDSTSKPGAEGEGESEAAQAQGEPEPESESESESESGTSVVSDSTINASNHNASDRRPAEYDHLVAAIEISNGLPRLGTNLSDRYVSQMLNLDLLGAIAFDKGCYPGQEIVARLKYRGTVKRRMQRYGCETPGQLPVAGEELLDADGNAAGEIVCTARHGNQTELLAVVQIDSHGPLALAADPSVALERLPLPFESESA